MLQIFDENFPLSANRRKGDYGSRTAVTQVSITTEDNLTLYPLKSYLRVARWIYKICYHPVAGYMNWTEAKQDESNKTSHAL